MKRMAFGTHEIAKFCHVTPATVSNWINKGLLQSFQTGGGHKRVWDKDILEFMRSHNIPILKDMNFQSVVNVLIVDDDLKVIGIVNKILKDKYNNNIEVYFASDGFEAGRKVELYLPELIILDMMLPGMDGFEVCKIIKSQQNLKATKILAISGHNEPEFVDHALKCGADDFLGKPIPQDQLIEKIEKLITIPV
jgi:CheY-like chemotaxis protein